MELTPELFKIGRRNFLKAVAGTSALVALGTTAILRGPVRGGPVRAALIGYGKQGHILRSCIDPEIMELVAICDIRPASEADTAELPGMHWYQDWRRLLEQEKIEAVLIATPLSTHAEIASACLEARKHVFCETAMASDANGCRQMIQAAQKNKRILDIAYQDYYEPLYWSAYQNILRQGILGDIYTIEAASDTYGSGREVVDPNMPTFDPRPWGYSSLEELANWRLHRKFSQGPIAERGGALISLANWFLESSPVAVQAAGGIYTYKDGRDVDDHLYATLDYPNGRTMTLSLIESNAFEGSYTQFMGTKGTLILTKGEALLFPEGQSKSSAVGSAKVGGSKPLLKASASRSVSSADHPVIGGTANSAQGGHSVAVQEEIAGFCGAIRAGTPLRGDAEYAYNTALTCFAVNDAVEQNKRVSLQGMQASAKPGEVGVPNDWLQHA